jgi:hypothetical protein
METWIPLRVTLHGSAVRVQVGPAGGADVGPEPVIEHVLALSPGSPAGRPGVRAWDEGLQLEVLRIVTPDGERELRAPDPGAAQRSLEALCLLLYNLNEFAFID